MENIQLHTNSDDLCLEHRGIRTDRILFNIFVIFFILILLPPFTIVDQKF